MPSAASRVDPTRMITKPMQIMRTHSFFTCSFLDVVMQAAFLSYICASYASMALDS